MTIPTEPIGSIPRPPELIAAVSENDFADPTLGPLFEEAIRDTIASFEATGSPIITDGEQRKYQNFWTYSVHGLAAGASGRTAAAVRCGLASPRQSTRGAPSVAGWRPPVVPPGHWQRS
jgi:hypothetical protein